MLPEFISGRLKPLATDLPSPWRLWQHKTFNIHRGVVHWDTTSNRAASPSVDQMRDEVRAVVRDWFRPSWWRGFGFGAIVSLAVADDSLQRVVDLVDVRNDAKGTWQWIVLYFPDCQAAVGVCTWTEGYLAPVYRNLLTAFEANGVTCESHRKDMDAVMKALVTIHKHLKTVKRILGPLQ